MILWLQSLNEVGHPLSRLSLLSRNLYIFSDPQLSTAKRKQRTQAFAVQMNHTSLERQVASLQASKSELEAKLRDKDAQIERLEGDRRWLTEREKEEREQKEREIAEHEEEKVCATICSDSLAPLNADLDLELIAKV